MSGQLTEAERSYVQSNPLCRLATSSTRSFVEGHFTLRVDDAPAAALGA